MTVGAFVAAGLAIALVLAFVVSPRASTQPDGLQRVAIDKGFDATARPHALDGTPLAGYETKGIDDGGLSRGAAGAIGVAVTFALGAGLFALVRRNRREPQAG